MLESRRGERSRLAGFAVERHSSQEAAMAPNLLTVRLDCSGLQHKRFVHFVRLSSSRDLGGRDFAIIWAKFSARIRKTPAHNPQKMERKMERFWSVGVIKIQRFK